MNAVALDFGSSYTDRLSRPPAPVTANNRYRPHAIDYVSQFHRILMQWRIETAVKSRVEERIASPAFAKIVKIGWPVVPLILSELRTRPDFLFLALHHITNENPLSEEDRGHPRRMVNAWLAWGARRGYLDD